MPEARHTQARTAIAALWQRNHPQILARLDILDRAAAAADSRTLTSRLRADAMDVAHKLAGSLGMFGFNEGTRLAREIEQALEQHVGSSAPIPLVPLTAKLRACLFPSQPIGPS